MNLKEFLEHTSSGKTIHAPSEAQEFCDNLLLEAIEIKMKLNCEYHTEDEIREIMAELTGQEVNETLRVVPPFHTDCGKNIHIGENVFINSNCTMQDQGGVYIGDDVLIGHNVCLLTLNHEFEPEKERNSIQAPSILATRSGLAPTPQFCPGFRSVKVPSLLPVRSSPGMLRQTLLSEGFRQGSSKKLMNKSDRHHLQYNQKKTSSN